VQLNFAYPWIVLGLALGALSVERAHGAKQTALVPAVSSDRSNRRAPRPS
jgi:hypothetical protein